MGQKTNPNIFRLGISKTWSTEFFEKKTKELAIHTYQDLEIKSYIEKFLNNYNLILHKYKIYYNNKNLHIFISYYVSSYKNVRNKTSIFNNKKLTVKNKIIKTQQKLSKNNFFNKKTKIAINYYRNKILLKIKNNNNFKYYTNKNLKKFNYNNLKQINKLELLMSKNSYKKFLEGLNLFTKHKYQITTTFFCVNKNFNLTLKQKNSLKKTLFKLQKFKNTNFFYESINILFIANYLSDSSNLVSKMVANQIKNLKRHKFFLTFLRKTLNLFIKSSFSKIKGIKIIAKGRINGAARARHKILTIGQVPIQTISSNISYAQTTCHNSNGSYGIKVWIVEKD
jgi:ribosomal protein S3